MTHAPGATLPDPRLPPEPMEPIPAPEPPPPSPFDPEPYPRYEDVPPVDPVDSHPIELANKADPEDHCAEAIAAQDRVPPSSHRRSGGIN